MFKVGDKVKLSGCPFDEQIPYQMDKYLEQKNKVQTVTEIKDVQHLSGTGGQWIKTNLNTGDWISHLWFKKFKKKAHTST